MNPYQSPAEIHDARPKRKREPDASVYLVMAAGLGLVLFGGLVWLRLRAMSLDMTLFTLFAVGVFAVALVRKLLFEREGD